MSTELVHVGFKNFIAPSRVVAIAMPNSAPIKRSIQDARDKGSVIDLTYGRKIKAVVFTDTKYMVLLSLETKTIIGRMAGGSDEASQS